MNHPSGSLDRLKASPLLSSASPHKKTTAAARGGEAMSSMPSSSHAKQHDDVQRSGSPSIKRLLASVSKCREEMQEQERENARLRELLARERRDRIRRVPEAKTALQQGPHDGCSDHLVSSPSRRLLQPVCLEPISDVTRTSAEEDGGIRMSSSPPPSQGCDEGELPNMISGGPIAAATSPTAAATAASTRALVSPSHAPTKKFALYLSPIAGGYSISRDNPLGCDYRESSAYLQQEHEHRISQIIAKEQSKRTSIVDEQRTCFLQIHRCFRLLKEDDARRRWMQQLIPVHRKEIMRLEEEEHQRRDDLDAQRRVAFDKHIIRPIERRIREQMEAEEQRERKSLWTNYTTAWRFQSNAERRRITSYRVAVEQLVVSCQSERTRIVHDFVDSREELHGQFTQGLSLLKEEQNQAWQTKLDDMRHQRTEVFEAEVAEERKRKQNKQKQLEIKHQEEKRLMSAWQEVESLCLRLARSEEELRSLILKVFRQHLSNVFAMEKLRRVEGYFTSALHETPAMHLVQPMHSPVAVAYAPQVCPNALVSHPQTLMAGQKRLGLDHYASLAPPCRRDSEVLPKHLRSIMHDETSPLFVGSYLEHGGMPIDPLVEFAVDMGETWCARLSVCWSYAREQINTTATQMHRRLVSGVHAADRVSKIVADDESVRRLVSKSSKKNLSRRRSSAVQSAADSKSDLFFTLSNELNDVLPQWVDRIKGVCLEEIRLLQQRFPRAHGMTMSPSSTPSTTTINVSASYPNRTNAGGNAAAAAAPPHTSAVSFAPQLELSSIGAQFLSDPNTPFDKDLTSNHSQLSSPPLSGLDNTRSLHDVLVELKTAKERISSACLRFQATRLPAELFEDFFPHKARLTLVTDDITAWQRLHPSVELTVVRGGQDDTDEECDETKLSIRLSAAESSECDDDNDCFDSSFISAFAVRDAVRLVRMRFDEDIDAWRIPLKGVPYLVEVSVTCDTAAVPHHLNAANLESLDAALKATHYCSGTKRHEANVELETFILPSQVLPTADRLTAAAAIPSHDCRSGKPMALCPEIRLRLIPRLIRTEQITTEVEVEDLYGSFSSLVSRRTSIAPDGAVLMEESSVVTTSSPVAGNINRSSSFNSNPTLSPKITSPTSASSAQHNALLSPGKRAMSLKREAIKRKSSVAMTNGALALLESETRGLEVTFSIYDGFSLADKLTIDHADGVHWDPVSTEVRLDQRLVGHVKEELCVLRIAFLSAIRVADIERVCRAVSLSCDTYNAMVGIRVVQIMLTRPWDRHHPSQSARWIPPCAAYVAVHILATDVPPTFFTPERVVYRSSIAAPQAASGKSAAAAASAAFAHSNESKPPKRAPIAAEAVVEDLDTQFFSRGTLTIQITNFESDDYLALDLKEYNEQGGVDGLRMEFVDSLSVASEITGESYEVTVECEQRTASTNNLKMVEQDRAYAILRYHGVPIGLLVVLCGVRSKANAAVVGPSGGGGGGTLQRRQSAVFGAAVLSQMRRASSLPRMGSLRNSAADASLVTSGLQWSTTSRVESNFVAFPPSDAEPNVQRPAGSLIASSTVEVEPMKRSAAVTLLEPDNTPSNTSPTFAPTQPSDKSDVSDIEGVSELMIEFHERAPFASVQMLLRSAMYYRSNPLVPVGETRVDIDIALGPTTECFDVHGDAIDPSSNDKPEAMHRTVVIERSPPLLVSLDKDKVINYPENSGPKRIFGKFAPLPADLLSFEGGFLRVEILHEDVEPEDELILDVQSDRIQRIFLKRETLQVLLPDTVGAAVNSSGKLEQSSRGGANATNNSEKPSGDSTELLLDMKQKQAQERRRSFQQLEAAPRDPPQHSGPPVAVTTMRRLQSLKKRDSVVTIAESSANREISSENNASSGGDITPPSAASKGLLSPPQAPSFDPFDGIQREESLMIPTQKANGRKKWNVVKQNVDAATVATRFVGAGSRSTEKPTGGRLYSKVFELVRQAATSQVQQRRQAEMDKHGIDDVMVQKMGQMPPNTTAAGSGGVHVCCLSDCWDENTLGTLFTRNDCLCISFDKTIPTFVQPGVAFSVKPQTIIQLLLPLIAYRSTSRNPSILQKRIVLTLSHPTCGQSVVMARLAIDPYDDPVEYTMQKPTLMIRSKSTELEPYTKQYIGQVLPLRKSYGVNLAMPESSFGSSGGSSPTNATPVGVRCLPRRDIIPLFPSWLTSLYDPDTFHWDGGRLSLKFSQATVNGNTVRPESLVTPRLLDAIRFMTYQEQVELNVELGVSNAQWWISCRSDEQNPAEMNVFVSPRYSNQEEALRNHAPHALLHGSPATDGKSYFFVGKMKAGNWAPNILEVQFSDAFVGEKWISLEILSHILFAFCVERQTVLEVMIEPENRDEGYVNNSVQMSIEVSIVDGPTAPPGIAVVTLDVQAPLLSWPSKAVPPLATKNSAKGSSALLQSSGNASSVATPRDAWVITASLREATVLQGEACFASLCIRLSERDKTGGGFIEMIPLGGSKEHDRISIALPNNQMVITSDGVIASKEGNLGRIYGMGSPYLRIDLAGWWFEGSKKLPPLKVNANTADVMLVAPPGIDVASGSGIITPSGAVQWSKQVAGRVTGKRLIALLRAIHFRTEVPEGGTAANAAGDRLYRLVVSDGKYDAFGRLEISQVDFCIQVLDAPLVKK